MKNYLEEYACFIVSHGHVFSSFSETVVNILCLESYSLMCMSAAGGCVGSVCDAGIVVRLSFSCDSYHTAALFLLLSQS